MLSTNWKVGGELCLLLAARIINYEVSCTKQSLDFCAIKSVLISCKSYNYEGSKGSHTDFEKLKTFRQTEVQYFSCSLFFSLQVDTPSRLE